MEVCQARALFPQELLSLSPSLSLMTTFCGVGDRSLCFVQTFYHLSCTLPCLFLRQSCYVNWAGLRLLVSLPVPLCSANSHFLSLVVGESLRASVCVWCAKLVSNGSFPKLYEHSRRETVISGAFSVLLISVCQGSRTAQPFTRLSLASSSSTLRILTFRCFWRKTDKHKNQTWCFG